MKRDFDLTRNPNFLCIPWGYGTVGSCLVEGGEEDEGGERGGDPEGDQGGRGKGRGIEKGEERVEGGRELGKGEG